MMCESCRGKGFVWGWDLSLRCFAHQPCHQCEQRVVVNEQPTLDPAGVAGKMGEPEGGGTPPDPNHNTPD